MKKTITLLVCPACAGMIRAAIRAQMGIRRLPRMRGDDPQMVSFSKFAAEFAPHARG